MSTSSSAARGADGHFDVGFILAELEQQDILEVLVLVLARVNDVARKIVDGLALRQVDIGQHHGLEIDAQAVVGDAASGGDVEVDGGAHGAEREAEDQDGHDEREQADAAGAGGGELLVGAEAAEDEQG